MRKKQVFVAILRFFLFLFIMKKLFRKKKLDKNLSGSNSIEEASIRAKNQPLFPTSAASSIVMQPINAPNELPILVMPKPRRPHTPTRALLSHFGYDKTQVEEEEQSKANEISPILLPAAREGKI